METIDSKIERLRLLLSEMGVVIGYSGGCDSTLLAAVGKEIIKERMVCVMTSSETYPSSEVEEAMERAVRLGITVMRIETDELKDADFAANTPDRCYFCKRELFGKLIVIGNAGYQNSSGNPHCNSKLKVVDLKKQ